MRKQSIRTYCYLGIKIILDCSPNFVPLCKYIAEIEIDPLEIFISIFPGEVERRGEEEDEMPFGESKDDPQV